MSNTGGNRNERWPRWVIPVYVVLLALAIPWYFPAGQVCSIVFGVPVWVAVSAGFSVVIAVLTAWLALFRWPVDTEGDDRGV